MNTRRFFPGTGAIIAFLAVMAVAVTGNIQTNDQILLPLPAKAIDAGVLSVSGHPPQPGRGALYFTFVREEQANLLTKLYHQYLDPSSDVVPNQAIYGVPQLSPQQQQQVEQQNVAYMIDSKKEAGVAAFTALGYRSLVTQQVAVSGIITGSKAIGVLQQNDVIVAANSQLIRSPQQLAQITQSLRPGAPVSLVVRRAQNDSTQMLHVAVPTIRNPHTGKASIGIYLGTLVDATLPYKVSISTDNVEGPSAGLMFALAIMNRLSKSDLTRGYKIAGTGTIDLAGNVGAIGGVKQKVFGARDVGAQYFFVPQDNYAEAKPFAQGITLLPVNTLGEALADLKKLDARK